MIAPDPLELHRDHAEFFRSLGERSPDSGATWQMQADFHARRLAG